LQFQTVTVLVKTELNWKK